MFRSPSAGGDICKPADVNGHLLIIKPVDYKPEVQTAFGTSEAVSSNVVDLDSTDPTTGQPVVYNGTLWFNVALINALKPEIGGLVLARMGQGTAKPGQSAPWLLQDATGDTAAVAKATAWMNRHPEFNGLTAPATQPAPTAVQQQAPAPAVAAVPAGIDPVTGEVSPELAALLGQLQAQQKSA